MERKLRVGVIFGGRSGEHEVSIASAASVMAALDKEKYEIVPIGITREGRWLAGVEPTPTLPGRHDGGGGERGQRHRRRHHRRSHPPRPDRAR